MGKGQFLAPVVLHRHSLDRPALAVAAFAGICVGDVVPVIWSAWDGEVLGWHQSKTGYDVHIRAPRHCATSWTTRRGVARRF
jgi:hypothetical protein